MEWTSHTLARHESGSQLKTYDTSRALRLSALSAVDRCIVRRIAHHRSLVGIYEDQPKASISRDGRYVAFTSNWGIVAGRRDVYIVVNIPPAPTS